MEIRRYEPKDEKSWVRCRVLSFLDTAYFDNVLRQKEHYENPSIELVAVNEGKIVGLLDAEYDTPDNRICTREPDKGAMIWHIAVHPDYQREGVGGKLLLELEKLAKELDIAYIEAWTRDDNWVRSWYENNKFILTSSYLHVFLERDELSSIPTSHKNMQLIQGWAHYTGENKLAIKEKYKRVHECVCYEKKL
ncbi:GNAT family N-acetyltransferase [Oceanobacillus kapialis]|uniref:GNAT family N-acetyltransferase n=1 Tax=Oceanobacillus kapialis TaxID=481353 RepID=UPI003851295E